MRKLLLILVAVVVAGLGASRWYANKQREQLIRTEIEKLGYRNTPDDLSQTAATLGRLGADAHDAIPALIKVLLRNEGLDPNLSVDRKHSVAGALVAIGPASVEPLLEAVHNPSNRERGWGIKPPGQVLNLPALFGALGVMRTKFGPQFDSTAIDETLRELMSNHDCPDVRLWAGRTIEAVQLRHGEGIPYPPSPRWTDERREIAYWIKGLENEDPHARAWAAHILGENSWQLREYVADWTEALPALAAAIQDSDSLVREESARSLYRLVGYAKGEARDVVATIIAAIEKAGKKESPSWSFYQQHLYWCLGEVGSEAESAVPFLLRIIQDQDNERNFRYFATNALGKIGDADAIPGLINTLHDADLFLVGASAEAIGQFGPRAKQAVPQLLKLLDDNRTHSHSYRIPAGHTERVPAERVPITISETVAEALKKIDPETARQATGL